MLTRMSVKFSMSPESGLREKYPHQTFDAEKSGLVRGSKQSGTYVGAKMYSTAFAISNRYQSTDICISASHLLLDQELSTKPSVSVSAVSGSRSGFPPLTPEC